MEYASLYAHPADHHRLLENFGLGALKKSFVARLSGGERQKLSVVLALIGNPELVFLDELTTGLDVVARREVWRTLKQLKEQGMTIFLPPTIWRRRRPFATGCASSGRGKKSWKARWRK